MKTFNMIFLITIPLYLAYSCNNVRNKKNFVQNSDVQDSCYVIDSNLSTKDYSSFTNRTPKGGFISTPKIASQVAEIIWTQIYGVENIKKQKPFSVNLENDIWIIEGSWDRSNNDTDGGNAYMEINKNTGEIIKVIHTK
jgi:hypothetical protein